MYTSVVSVVKNKYFKVYLEKNVPFFQKSTWIQLNCKHVRPLQEIHIFKGQILSPRGYSWVNAAV